MKALKVIFKTVGIIFLLLVLCTVVLVGCFAYALFNGEEFSSEFALIEEDYTDFEEAAAKFEESVVEGKNEITILLRTADFTGCYYYIEAQYTVAYINYCKDMKDEKAVSDYEFAFKMLNDAGNLYNETLKRLLLSDSEYAKELFAEWSEEDKELLINNSERAYELSEANEKLLMEYRDLDIAAENWIEAVDDIYLEVVLNNNAIAKEYGYTDYYEYASGVQYRRNYTESQRQKLRLYVKEYIIPLSMEIYDRIEALYESADEETVAKYSALMGDSYNENEEVRKYIDEYTEAFWCDPEDYTGGLGQSMANMFEEEMAIFANGENAMPAAYTTYMTYYAEPIAYFGPGYQDMLTVVHEAGHYAAFDRLAMATMPLDLCEVHSQANEWMFVAYLEGKLAPEVYELIMLTRLSRGLDTVILATAVDECEEKIYSSVTDTATAEDIAALITETLATYGAETVETYNMEKYFRRVAVDNPVYYLSYATSEIVSITSFIDAESDLAAAQKEYTEFVDSSLLSDAIGGGLTEAFEETTFTRIVDEFSKAAEDNDNATPDDVGSGTVYFDGEEEVLLPAA